jgi:hypothetical protein
MTRYSGKAWAEILKVEILEPTGWDNATHYENGLIGKLEFCNRASNSKLKTQTASTRREASEKLQQHFKNNELLRKSAESK